MKLHLYYIISAAIFFFGCEKTSVVDADIEYQENIVVQAELRSGKLFDGVKFTKTLPFGVEYNISKAELKDVTAYIKINGVQVIPLHYTSNGLYKPLYELLIEPGKFYELFGERGATKFYSSTSIPYPPHFNKAFYNGQTNSFNLYVVPKYNEVFGAVWIINNNQNMSSSYFVLSDPGVITDSILITTDVLPEKYRSPAFDNSRYVKLFAYDAQFYKFYKSIKNNESVTNVFIQGEGSISWNITGDRVMGLFIGSAEGDLKFVN